MGGALNDQRDKRFVVCLTNKLHSAHAHTHKKHIVYFNESIYPSIYLSIYLSIFTYIYTHIYIYSQGYLSL